MELIDVHTHVGLDLGFFLRGWWPYACTAADLVSLLDANGIRRAVCFPFTLPSAFDADAFASSGQVRLRDRRIPFDRENPLLADEIDRLGLRDRLIQFAMFDPARKPTEQATLIESSASRYAGLKAQTTVLQSPIRQLMDDGRDLMDLARQRNWPVLFHTSILATDQWAQVNDCLAVAEAYPDIRFNLAHSLRLSLDGLRRAAELPNVWVDCSAHLNHCKLAREDAPLVPPRGKRVDADYSKPADVLMAIHSIMKGRYLWGSDNPYMSWCDDKLRLLFSYKEEADVLHALPQAVKEDMGNRAPLAWLGKTGGAP